MMSVAGSQVQTFTLRGLPDHHASPRGTASSESASSSKVRPPGREWTAQLWLRELQRSIPGGVALSPHHVYDDRATTIISSGEASELHGLRIDLDAAKRHGVELRHPFVTDRRRVDVELELALLSVDIHDADTGAGTGDDDFSLSATDGDSRNAPNQLGNRKGTHLKNLVARKKAS